MMTFANNLNHVSLPLSLKLLVVAVLSWPTVETVVAQSPEPADLIPIYGFDEDEFIIGAWATKWALTDTSDVWSREVGEIWPFIDAMGLNLLFANANIVDVDDIYTSALREEGTHRYRTGTAGAPKVYQSAFARGIRFFPFDTVQVRIPGAVVAPERGWYFFSTPDAKVHRVFSLRILVHG